MKQVKSPLVFIVDDDKMYREIIKNGLEGNNFRGMETFSNGQQCLDQLYRMPDIVLLDYDLGAELNGVEVLKKIKAFNPDIQVILLSGQDKLEVAVNSMKYGSYDYVIKNDAAIPRICHLIQRIGEWSNFMEQRKRFKRNKVRTVRALGAVLAVGAAFMFLVLKFFA